MTTNSNSGSGSSWQDLFTAAADWYLNHRAGETARNQMHDAQQQLLDMWQRGSYSQQSPYMANEINPLLRAALGEQLRLYNGSRGNQGLGMLDMSNFLTGIPGVGVDPNAPGVGSFGSPGPGGAAGQPPFGHGAPAVAANSPQADPNYGGGFSRGNVPRDQGQMPGGFGGSPMGGGMMDGSNSYDGGYQGGGSSSTGGIMDWLRGLGSSVTGFENNHPIISSAARGLGNILSPVPGGASFIDSLLHHLAGGQQLTPGGGEGNWVTPDGVSTDSFGNGQLERNNNIPVPNSVVDNGWDNLFRGDGMDFWNSIQGSAFGGMNQGQGGGGRLYGGSATPWSWGDSGGFSF
jgi:hypothetical protein